FEPGGYARVPLPHYPWQRERHWSSAALPVVAGATGKRRAPLDDAMRSWLHTSRWEPLAAEGSVATRVNWLLVSGSDSGNAWAAALRELGGRADVVASVDEALGWLSRADGARVQGLGIVLFAAPGAQHVAWDAVAALQRLQRAWPAERSAPRVWWVTTGAQALPDDSEPVIAAQAALWGAARVIAAEHPHWWGGLVDVGAAHGALEAKAAAQHLRSGSSEDQVAVRGAVRSVLRLVRADVSAEGLPGARWRTDGAYLITGGLGGIALEIAKAMVASGARRLVLLGRTALPVRSAWTSEPETSVAGRRIAAIRALEHAGAAVHVLHADVADAEQMRAALDAYRAEGWPAICGVIHSAAVTDNKLTAEMEAAVFERVLAPKLAGALVLDALLPTLDLFVLFSSMSAFWGPPGMSNYSAANAGLDAVAQARRARGQHALSIQWGHWTNIGLSEGVIAERNAEELERVGVGSMSVAQGTALFASLLARPEAVIAVLPIAWAKFRSARRGRDWPLFRVAAGSDADADADAAAGSFAERARAATPVARRALIERVIREALGVVLHRPAKQLDARRSFGSVGLDSLMALEFRNRLESALERALPATLAWNYPTIEQLTAHLDGHFSAELVADAPPAAAPNSALDDVDAALLFTDIASLSDADAARALRGGR
ncbi:MAG: beta-ketoacyl reductase, partial [Polyangiaceae bacterium]